MADEKQYTTVAGMIQFDVETRDVNGGEVRDVTIRSLASGNLVRITVWPEFKATPLERGDFISVDGDVRIRTVGEGENVRTYTNVNARRLAVLPQAAPADRETENTSGSAERPSTF